MMKYEDHDIFECETTGIDSMFRRCQLYTLSRPVRMALASVNAVPQNMV